MNIQMELSKTKATLQNLINSIEANKEVDVLGSILAIADQLDRLDEAIDSEL